MQLPPGNPFPADRARPSRNPSRCTFRILGRWHVACNRLSTQLYASNRLAQAVNDLVDQALSLSCLQWPCPPLHFCRGDPNIRNFIRRPDYWASVDWEYSGCGDPAFEIADFLVHAAHIAWPRRQTRRLVDHYCAHSGDAAIRDRIPIYETLILVWWTLRLGRLLPEARSGADKRLAELSHSWYEGRLALQSHYRQLAAAALAGRNVDL